MLALLFVLEVGKSETPRSPNNDLEFLYALYFGKDILLVKLEHCIPLASSSKTYSAYIGQIHLLGNLIARGVEERSSFHIFDRYIFARMVSLQRAFSPYERKKKEITLYRRREKEH